MKKKPYVVSADIYLLLTKWAKQKNFVLPKEEFIQQFRKEFCDCMLKIFPCFEFISEKEILDHLQTTTASSGLPCVSLDPVYLYCNYSLELTRKVDLGGFDQGLHSRFGNTSLLTQLSCLKANGIKEVCLVDDVIFSGDLMERIIELLANVGISVPVVCAGIGIQDGVSRVLSPKTKVECAKIYIEVIDEVCERDFYPGVPFSGRSLIGESNIGLPYIIPFGKPRKWASIPTYFHKEFSKFCIDQAIILFEEIQRISNKEVCCSDIERKVPQQPIKGSYIEFLKRIVV